MGTHSNRSHPLLLDTEVNGAHMEKETNVLPELPVKRLAPLGWESRCHKAPSSPRDPQTWLFPQPLPEKLNKSQKPSMQMDDSHVPERGQQKLSPKSSYIGPREITLGPVKLTFSPKTHWVPRERGSQSLAGTLSSNTNQGPAGGWRRTQG